MSDWIDQLTSAVMRAAGRMRVFEVSEERGHECGMEPRRTVTLVNEPAHEGDQMFVIDVAKLAKALESMPIKRPDADGEIERMQTTAYRVRADLQRTIDVAWDECWAEKSKVETLDAFLAGLSIRYPDSVKDLCEEAEARRTKETDGEWRDYLRLHAKFEGERP